MTTKKLYLMTMIKLEWLNDYSQEQIQVFRDHENLDTKENIQKYYELFLNLNDYRKVKLKVTMKDVDRLYKITKDLMKNIWLKNRYPEYYSKQWADLSVQFHLYWSDLLFLQEIKDGTRSLDQLVHIFRY